VLFNNKRKSKNTIRNKKKPSREKEKLNSNKEYKRLKKRELSRGSKSKEKE